MYKRQEAGIPFTGHTELVAELCGTDRFAMMQSAGGLRVIFVTTHIALKDVSAAVTQERIMEVARLLEEAAKAEDIPHPRIAVAGLNPHAGENGHMGREDEETVKPAIRKLQESGMDVSGPYPSDTLFIDSIRKTFDGIVSMYHDQGHIPLKVEGFKYNKELKKWDAVAGVNVTLGLPIIRASVDHGTGEGHAGDGSANELSLVNAMDYAIRMANAKKEKGVEA